MGIWYATREAVKAAAGISGTEEHPSIDRLLESASREIERRLHRHFYPLTGKRYYNYPGFFTPYSVPWILWLNADLIDATLVTAGGTTIAAADYFEEPANYGPPFNRIEIDLASDAYFESGDTHQRAIEITGRWGYCEDTIAAGSITEADDGTETELDVSDSSLIGVGDLVLIDAEQMLCTAKALMTTTSAVDMAGHIDADEAVVAITFDGAGSPLQGEVITIDAERMLVESIAGAIASVRRARDGTVLASHLDNAVIYAPRRITVERAYAGTTDAGIAGNLINTTLTKNVPPGIISELCIAEVLFARAQEKGHFALTVGKGEAEREVSGRGIADLRKRAEDAYRRWRGPRAI